MSVSDLRSPTILKSQKNVKKDSLLKNRSALHVLCGLGRTHSVFQLQQACGFSRIPVFSGDSDKMSTSVCHIVRTLQVSDMCVVEGQFKMIRIPQFLILCNFLYSSDCLPQTVQQSRCGKTIVLNINLCVSGGIKAALFLG